jgi:restriction system protein
MEQNTTNRPFIIAEKLSLEEWLKLIGPHEEDRTYRISDYQFPTDEMKDQYLQTIQNRSDDEIKSLLRRFLISGGGLGSDSRLLSYWQEDPNRLVTAVEKFEFAKRMLSDRHTWEGNTWILDLIPSNPHEAIAALHAYILAHIQWLPDGRWMGLSDAMSIIRARYCNYAHPSEVIMTISSRDFEILVAALFERIGYKIKLTQETRDGGYDILGIRVLSGLKEQIVVECKKHSQRIGVKAVRELCGVVESSRANKGVLVGMSGFTSNARQFARRSRIDLIGWDNLCKLFNRHLGQDWPKNIDFIISLTKAKQHNKLLHRIANKSGSR